MLCSGMTHLVLLDAVVLLPEPPALPAAPQEFTRLLPESSRGTPFPAGRKPAKRAGTDDEILDLDRDRAGLRRLIRLSDRVDGESVVLETVDPETRTTRRAPVPTETATCREAAAWLASQ
jgi:hypothetical protein